MTRQLTILKREKREEKKEKKKELLETHVPT
jgi:hypothetical protein